MDRTEADRGCSSDVELAPSEGRTVEPRRAPDTQATAGDVLWTLTRGRSTAQARRWITAAGFEFELQIWTGLRAEGAEDLCWTQMFDADEAMAAIALIKKRQLLDAGWIEHEPNGDLS